MPLLDYDHPATWPLIYRGRVNGERVTYGRKWLSLVPDTYTRRASWLHGELPSGPGLIVGCGFGFLVEALADLGRTDVWGCDSSAWIHARIPLEARPDVLSRLLRKDPREPDALSWFRATVGRTFRWVVTEEVLSSYDDVEAGDLHVACMLLAATVIHIDGDAYPAPFRSRTEAAASILWPGSRYVATRDAR